MFILDNVENLEDIKEILGNFSNHKFIITTKKENLFPATTYGIQIKPFGEKDCLNYMRLIGIKVKSKEEEKEWIELIRRSTFERMAISPRTFESPIKLYKTKASFGKKELEESLKYESLSIYEQLLPENILILKYLSFLDGEYIDYELIKEIFKEETTIRDEHLDYLVEIGYLKKNMELMEMRQIEMHETVQKEVQALLDKELNQQEKNAILLKVIKIVNSLIGDDISYSTNKTSMNKLIKMNKHGMKLIKENFKSNDSNYLGLLLKMSTINSKVIINYEFLVKMGKNILAIQEETLPSNHPDIATSLNNIGLVYSDQGKYDEALEYYKRSLKIYEETLPSNHPDIATSLNNIG